MICSCKFGCFSESAAACFKPFHTALLLRGAKIDIGQIKDDIACISFSVLEYPSISTFRAAVFDISALGVFRGQRVGPLRYALKLGRRGAGVTGVNGRNIDVGECRGSPEGFVSGSGVACMKGRRKVLVGAIIIWSHALHWLPVCVAWSSLLTLGSAYRIVSSE